MGKGAALEQEQHKRAKEYLQRHLEHFCELNGALETLKKRMEKETSTPLFAWLDHFGIAYAEEEGRALLEMGFNEESKGLGYFIYSHPAAELPRVVLHDQDRFRLHGVAVNVESITDFLMVRGLSCPIEGAVYGSYRRAAVAMENGVGLWVEERRGNRSMMLQDEVNLAKYHEAAEVWRARPRRWADQADCLNHSIERARQMVELVGPHVAAHLVCEAERAYWQSRNQAAQLQKMRQDRLGLGWANHDHHTFRSSRQLFPELVSLFELLGFSCRERFYAERGWGTQGMENVEAGLRLFLEVDVTPEEMGIDFAHQTLSELPQLGIVGLWCGLHGDSILEAGMHHLSVECDVRALGMGAMSPTLTIGELWPVKTHRIRSLLDQGMITEGEADVFLHEGAVGSHLASLEKREAQKAHAII